MNLLLTMNCGGTYIGPNVEASHRAAADRWGCQYTQIYGGSENPFAAKIANLSNTPWRLRLRCSNDRACWIDGDAIIREDAPSPFDEVPLHAIGGVNCNTSQDTASMIDGWGLAVAQATGVLCDPIGPDDTYLNGGFFVFTPSVHREVWRSLVRHRLDENPTLCIPGILDPMAEQTAWNMMIRAMGFPVHTMDPAWNVMGERAWMDRDMQHGYVYHLANVGTFRGEAGDKRAALEAINWRVRVAST